MLLFSFVTAKKASYRWTLALAKESLKKIQASTGLEPRPLKYKLSALPTELRSCTLGETSF